LRELPGDIMDNDSIPNPYSLESSELLSEVMDLTRSHLSQLTQKVKDGSELTTQDAFALCSYIKTLTGFEKAKREFKKDDKKQVSQLSDEELQEELKKLGIGGI
jgi:hypothetical protein